MFLMLNTKDEDSKYQMSERSYFIFGNEKVFVSKMKCFWVLFPVSLAIFMAYNACSVSKIHRATQLNNVELSRMLPQKCS